MTPTRIKELRDYITGNGTPRDWVPMESKELLELLRMAESYAKTPKDDEPPYRDIELPIDYEALAVAFRSAKWKWGDGNDGTTFPTSERLRINFEMLLRDANKAGCISTGGLMVYSYLGITTPKIHKRLIPHYLPAK